MTYPIISVKQLTVTTAAQEVAVDCNSFLLKNNGDATLYFCEAADGEAVTEANGFPVAAGETIPVVLNAKTLSMVATAQTDARLLMLGEGW